MLQTLTLPAVALLAMPAVAQDDAPALDYKHTNLTDDGDVWVSLDGHARARGEFWNNFGGADANDDNFLLTRVLLGGNLHVGEQITARVALRGSYSEDRDMGNGTLWEDAGLHDAYIDGHLNLEGDDKIGIRLGRQGFTFGRQRLVSRLPWANTMRAWDGVKVYGEFSGWRVDAFASYFVTPEQDDALNEMDDDHLFAGVYAAGDLGDNLPSLDGYVFYQDFSDARDTQRITLGARAYDSYDNGLGYDIEVAYQTGEQGARDISAYMLAAEVSYKLGDAVNSTVLGGLDYASGDSDGADDTAGTFNQLYPLGHAYFGQIDLVGRQNIIDLWAAYKATPAKNLSVLAGLHYLTLADDADVLYHAGGEVVGTANAGESDVGIELDLKATYKWGKSVVLEGGYSHLIAGSALDEDIDFLYLQTIVKF